MTKRIFSEHAGPARTMETAAAISSGVKGANGWRTCVGTAMVSFCSLLGEASSPGIRKSVLCMNGCVNILHAAQHANKGASGLTQGVI